MQAERDGHEGLLGMWRASLAWGRRADPQASEAVFYKSPERPGRGGPRCGQWKVTRTGSPSCGSVHGRSIRIGWATRAIWCRVRQLPRPSTEARYTSESATRLPRHSKTGVRFRQTDGSILATAGQGAAELLVGQWYSEQRAAG